MKIVDDNKVMEMLREGKKQYEIAEYFGVGEPCISKRIKRLNASPSQIFEKHGLNAKERRFVVKKLAGKSSTEAALVSCEVTSRESAKVVGSNLMNKPGVAESIKELMDNVGLTRRYRIERLKSCVDSPSGDITLKALDLTFRLADEMPVSKSARVNLNLNGTVELDAQEFFARCKRDNVLPDREPEE